MCCRYPIYICIEPLSTQCSRRLPADPRRTLHRYISLNLVYSTCWAQCGAGSTHRWCIGPDSIVGGWQIIWLYMQGTPVVFVRSLLSIRGRAGGGDGVGRWKSLPPRNRQKLPSANQPDSPPSLPPLSIMRRKVFPE